MHHCDSSIAQLRTTFGLHLFSRTSLYYNNWREPSIESTWQSTQDSDAELQQAGYCSPLSHTSVEARPGSSLNLIPYALHHRHRGSMEPDAASPSPLASTLSWVVHLNPPHGTHVARQSFVGDISSWDYDDIQSSSLS